MNPAAPTDVRTGYALWAPTYDAENAVTSLERAAVRRLTASLAGAGARLLDAGCGTGRRLPRGGAAPPGLAVGIDLVPAMLLRARMLRRTMPLAAADVCALPFRDAFFDMVWSRLVLGHLPALAPAYVELARVTRPGGHVLVTDFHAAAARAGHVRSFRDETGTLRVLPHYLYDAAAHDRAAYAAGLAPVALLEPVVGAPVRRFYAARGWLQGYERQRGLPLVLARLYRA